MSEIDKGTENGLLNDSERFGEANTPSTPVVAYNNNVRVIKWTNQFCRQEPTHLV